MFKHINCPEISVGTVIDDIENMSKSPSEQMHHLFAVKKQLQEAEEEYRIKKGEYFKIAPEESVDELSNEEAVSLYKSQFRPKARKLYPSFFNVGVCPICGSNVPDTLDHVLPKSKYSQFALTPVNLVPMCSACNRNKLDVVFESGTHTPFHPYFEDLSALKGLTFEIVPDSDAPITVAYLHDADAKFLFDMKLYKMDQFIEVNANEKVSISIQNMINYFDSSNLSTEDLKWLFTSLQNFGNPAWENILYKFLVVNVEKVKQCHVFFSSSK